MKNKGRRHIVGIDSGTSNNGGGNLTHVTRPIRSMSSKGLAINKFDKKKWIKRIRGYFKSQTKEI